MSMKDLFAAVMELNLDPIKTKLMHVESGEGWSREKADAVETEYRRFLCLMRLYPKENTAPMVDVDTFWHYHILDTVKYAADCEQVFGYFLHHYPYVGMGGEEDEQFRVDSGDRMGELYEATFGLPYPGSAPQAAQAADATAYCAGPWREPARAEGNATAYCAGPWRAPARAEGNATAYCAGPWREPARAEGNVTAYCAGPWRAPAQAKGNATAYCAGPWRAPAQAKGNATAYCAGPWGEPARAEGSATAYCAGPWREPARDGGTAVTGTACAA